MAEKETYDDATLLSLISKEDETALTLLYKKYWQPLYNDAFKRLKNKEQSLDIVHDVFVDLWRRRNEAVILNLQAYLHTAVKYQVYKMVGRNQNAAGFFELFENIGASAYGAEERVINNELMQLIVAWMLTLPEKRREVFRLYYAENLSADEIAAQLNISPKTVRNQLGTSLEAFRAQLAKLLMFLSF